MKLELGLRDVSIKCKKLRRNNNATGTLRKNGEIIPILVKGSDVDKYVKRYGVYNDITVSFDGCELVVKAINVEKHNIDHNITNIDFEVVQ